MNRTTPHRHRINGGASTTPQPLPTEAGRRAADGPHLATPAGGRTSLRIAVADHDATSLESFRRFLAESGHAVSPAATGVELLEACRRERPDVVVADLELPGLTGLEVAEALARERPTAFVLLSGHPEADVLDRARAAGVLAYLDKPLSRAELGAAVVLAWEQFRQLQALRQEVEELRQSLAERKLIERAKEAVAHRLGVIEGEAFVRMRKYASDRNLKLAEAAQAVLDAERIFQDLELAP